jgi:acetylornithine deacetylase/succinyl-diaminopimelate desuccinylase-like protein
MKDQAASWIANLIRYRQEGYVPDRDVIVALTTDEETRDHIKQFSEEREFLYRLVKALSSPSPPGSRP